MAPVSAGERIDVVDVLRGWALFGILLVNMEFFVWPMSYMFQPHLWPDAPDRIAETGRFQFGPAEWFWRSLTYGQRQPMLLPAAK